MEVYFENNKYAYWYFYDHFYVAEVDVSNGYIKRTTLIVCFLEMEEGRDKIFSKRSF